MRLACGEEEMYLIDKLQKRMCQARTAFLTFGEAVRETVCSVLCSDLTLGFFARPAGATNTGNI